MSSVISMGGPNESKLIIRSVLGIGKVSALLGGMSVLALTRVLNETYGEPVRFRAAGDETREREGLFKGLLGNEKAVCS